MNNVAILNMQILQDRNLLLCIEIQFNWTLISFLRQGQLLRNNNLELILPFYFYQKYLEELISFHLYFKGSILNLHPIFLILYHFEIYQQAF